MEGLLNEYGWAAFGPVLVLLALPLMVAGLMLRRRGRRRAGGVELARASKRNLGDVSAGLVAVEGAWRGLDGGRGIVEDPDAPERRVLVEREPDAPAIDEGAVVTVIGLAARQVDDPRGTGYRGPSRVWVIEAHGGEHHASVGTGGLERAARAARTLSSAGAALFAAGLLVALATGVIAYRAAQDEGVQTSQVE
jgi:hypothetical protein